MSHLKAGLTQTDLASKIGKTESSVRKYESGLTEIPLSVLSKIADVLDDSLYSILGMNLDYMSKELFDATMPSLAVADDSSLNNYLEMLDYHRNVEEMSDTEKIKLLTEVSSMGFGKMKLKTIFSNNNTYSEDQKKEMTELMDYIEGLYLEMIDILRTNVIHN